MRNAMIIDGKDNVIVAIEPIAKGDTVTSAAVRKRHSLHSKISPSITNWPPATLPQASRW